MDGTPQFNGWKDSFPAAGPPSASSGEDGCRNGNRVSLAPAVARLKNVVVKAA